jgi:hypothetical protein
MDSTPLLTDHAPRGRDRADDLVCAVVVFLLPAVYVSLLLSLPAADSPKLALLSLPAAFTAAGALACAIMRVSVARAVAAAVGCLWCCFLVGCAAVAVDALLS